MLDSNECFVRGSYRESQTQGPQSCFDHNSIRKDRKEQCPNLGLNDTTEIALRARVLCAIYCGIIIILVHIKTRKLFWKGLELRQLNNPSECIISVYNMLLLCQWSAESRHLEAINLIISTPCDFLGMICRETRPSINFRNGGECKIKGYGDIPLKGIGLEPLIKI